MIFFFSNHTLDAKEKFKNKSVLLLMEALKPWLNNLLCCHPSVSKCAQSCSDGDSGLHQSPPKTDLSSAKPHFELTVGNSWGHKLLSSLPRPSCSSLTELPHNFFPPLYSAVAGYPLLVSALSCQILLLSLIFPSIILDFQDSRHSPIQEILSLKPLHKWPQGSH